jgi:small-conductance mechanosensitive channel
VKSLEALAPPPAGNSLQHAALPAFDRALHQLEVTSVKTRARAEAIIARGQTYFDEWKENLSGMTNRATAQAEAGRYARLREHFERVRQRSGEVRDEFRPFMAKLREFRARLDQTGTATGGEPARPELDELTTRGRRVLQTLDSVANALNEAEAELRATLAARP